MRDRIEIFFLVIFACLYSVLWMAYFGVVSVIEVVVINGTGTENK